jgi:hypothetical protein
MQGRLGALLRAQFCALGSVVEVKSSVLCTIFALCAAFPASSAMVVQSAQNGNNTVVTVVGTDGNVYLNFENASTNQWWTWINLGSAGGGFLTSPAMVVQSAQNGNNTLITAAGADGNVYLNWQNASSNQWSGWTNLGSAGGGFLTSPAMIVQSAENGYNTLVTAPGADGNVYLNWQNASSNQ